MLAPPLPRRSADLILGARRGHRRPRLFAHRTRGDAAVSRALAPASDVEHREGLGLWRIEATLWRPSRSEGPPDPRAPRTHAPPTSSDGPPDGRGEGEEGWVRTAERRRHGGGLRAVGMPMLRVQASRGALIVSVSWVRATESLATRRGTDATRAAAGAAPLGLRAGGRRKPRRDGEQEKPGRTRIAGALRGCGSCRRGASDCEACAASLCASRPAESFPSSKRSCDEWGIERAGRGGRGGGGREAERPRAGKDALVPRAPSRAGDADRTRVASCVSNRGAWNSGACGRARRSPAIARARATLPAACGRTSSRARAAFPAFLAPLRDSRGRLVRPRTLFPPCVRAFPSANLPS